MMCSLRGVTAVAASSVALLGACSGEGGTAPVVPCADDQEVTVTVSPGLSPTFTWSPACGMASLDVFPAEGGPAKWVLYVEGPAENPLRSGVRYGQAPGGAVAPAPARPLEGGGEYMITVYRWVGEPGEPGSLFPRGSATFRH